MGMFFKISISEYMASENTRTLMKTNMKPRDMSVELMRICMMFGIVLLHFVTQDGYFDYGGLLVRKGINLLSPCVEEP